jgi:hypothetical protein
VKGDGPLAIHRKVALAARVWLTFLRVRPRLHAWPLPRLVAHLGRPARLRRPPVHDPRRLSRAVHGSLRLGRRRPACIMSSLVLFRLLRRQGDPAELVIGLPERPVRKDAHAWVELTGQVVGPPPGRRGHAPMARYS